MKKTSIILRRLMSSTSIIILLLLALTNLNKVYSQNKKNYPFQMVKVPDSIAVLLKAAYKDDANAERNIFNLLNRKDFVFKDGIYSFKGQGPHFPRRLFIYNKNKLFIFESIGTFYSKGVVEEFTNCIELLELTNEQVVKYSQVISNYLQSEENNNYGREVKN